MIVRDSHTECATVNEGKYILKKRYFPFKLKLLLTASMTMCEIYLFVQTYKDRNQLTIHTGGE